MKAELKAEVRDCVPTIGRKFFAVANDVLDRMIQQGRQSAAGSCLYFSGHGRCAVGWTMPFVPDHNDEGLELLLIDLRQRQSHGEEFPAVVTDCMRWASSHITELLRLQRLHDTPLDVGHLRSLTSNWPDDLKAKMTVWQEIMRKEIFKKKQNENN